MIIGHFSRISFSEFARSLAPAALVGLAINFAIVSFGFRNVLRATAISREPHAVQKLDRGLFAIVCIVLLSIFACFVAGLNLAWTALAGAVLVMVLARRDTHEVLKLVDWHLLVFFAALFVVVEGLSDTGLARRDLSPSTADVRSTRDSAGVELNLVFCGRLKHFLQRAVCSRGRKMDSTFRRPCADVESACPGDDFRRQPYNHRFGREHDRSGIRAGTSRNWLLGLRAVWHSHHDSNYRCRDFRAAHVALRNWRCSV